MTLKRHLPQNRPIPNAHAKVCFTAEHLQISMSFSQPGEVKKLLTSIGLQQEHYAVCSPSSCNLHMHVVQIREPPWFITVHSF